MKGGIGENFDLSFNAKNTLYYYREKWVSGGRVRWPATQFLMAPCEITWKMVQTATWPSLNSKKAVF